MTAREMFEKLGYKVIYDNDYSITYRKNIDTLDGSTFVDIRFDKTYKTFSKYYNDGIAEYIDLEELEAIGTQIKELGWKR